MVNGSPTEPYQEAPPKDNALEWSNILNPYTVGPLRNERSNVMSYENRRCPTYRGPIVTRADQRYEISEPKLWLIFEHRFHLHDYSFFAPKVTIEPRLSEPSSAQAFNGLTLIIRTLSFIIETFDYPDHITVSLLDYIHEYSPQR